MKQSSDERIPNGPSAYELFTATQSCLDFLDTLDWFQAYDTEGYENPYLGSAANTAKRALEMTLNILPAFPEDQPIQLGKRTARSGHHAVILLARAFVRDEELPRVDLEGIGSACAREEEAALEALRDAQRGAADEAADRSEHDPDKALEHGDVTRDIRYWRYKDRVVVGNDKYAREITGPQRIRLFVTVVNQRAITWKEVLVAWMHEDGVPRTETDSLRRSGNRIMHQLKELKWIWEQDGRGARIAK